MKFGLHIVDRPIYLRYRERQKGIDMNATYGFRAAMTARPGKGDELLNLLLSATADGSGASENCVVFLVGRSASNRDVVYVTEGWTTKEAHADNFATEQAKAFVARIAPLLRDEPEYQDEVPVGGKFRG
jgi:quinol monooxygenase YgiN